MTQSKTVIFSVCDAPDGGSEACANGHSIFQHIETIDDLRAQEAVHRPFESLTVDPEILSEITGGKFPLARGPVGNG